MMPFQANSPVDLAPDVLAALKHYEIRSRLSSDHTGQVFEAWDKQLCRTVVIRQIQHLGAAEEEVIKQARLAASLKHAAFAKIHALEEAGDSLLIVTEAVNGVSLSQWIASAACVEKRVLDHIANIATALLEAHQMGLVHGDLQASQFIVDQSGKIRILNCGFVSSSASYMLGSLDQINARGGIAYLAPERFSNAPASPAADVYALGCLLYEMLNGSLPFAHLQGLAMVAALVQSDPEQWPWSAKLTPAARKLMLAMCQRQPEQRINCAQVLEECRTMRANDPYSGSVGSLSLAALQAQLAKAQRRQHFYKLSVAVLALVLLAGTSWQLKPHWPQIVKALTPYSESREFESAMQAIVLYDSPGLLEKAEQHLTTMLAHDSTNAKAVAGLSVVYSLRLRGENRDEVWRERSVASAQQALKLNADLPITRIAYAMALDPHRDFDTAIKAVRRAKELEPENLLAWRAEVHVLLLGRQYEELLRVSERAMNKFPKDWVFPNYLGVLFLNQAKYKEAEQAFKRSVSNRPDSVSPYSFLSQALNKQGKTVEALQALQQGLQLRSSSLLYNKFAEIKLAQGDQDAAIAAWQKAVSPAFGNPNDYEAWKRLGDAFRLMLGKSDESTRAYLKAQQLLEPRLRRRPNEFSFLYYMSQIDFRLGKYQDARGLIDHALVLFPSKSELYILSAVLYRTEGKKKEADQAIQVAKRQGATASQMEDFFGPVDLFNAKDGK